MPNNDSQTNGDAEDSNTLEKNAYKAGITPGDKGNMYQKRWTLYLALKAYLLPMQFWLSFELPVAEAGLFDDILLKIHGKLYYIQVKHCSTTKKVKREKFIPKVKDEKGGFALSKYNGSLPKLSADGENSKLFCILLTNAALDEDCSDLFNEATNLDLEIDDWEKGKILCLAEACKDVEKFHEKFVKHFLLLTQQQGLEELAEQIKALLRGEFSNTEVENVFYMLEYEMTRLIHEESTLSEPKTNKWLKKLFAAFREQNCFKFFCYTFEDIVQNYPDVKLKSKTELLDGKIAVLPYHRFYLLRMIQAKQMVGEDDFWFIPLESWEQKPDSCVLKALKDCQTSRVLILLDNGEKKCLVRDTLMDRSEMIKKVIVITNRNASELKDHLVGDVQEDAKEISLEDLECSDSYSSYKVSFQGQMVKLSDLPSFDAFKSELSGDPLITLIRDKTLSIGSDLSEGAPSMYYKPRRLAVISFEINATELAGRTIITAADQEIPNSAGEIFVCASIADQIQQKCPVHILNPNGDDKWDWRNSVPNTVRIIATAIEDFKEQRDSFDDDLVAEDAIATRIDTVFKPIVELVRLIQKESAVDEDRFVEALNGEQHERMVIIGGETGAGKSTTLRRLAELHKKKFPLKWVVFANLCGHKLVESGEESAEIDSEWIKEFLLTRITSEDHSYVARYFAKCSPSDVVVYIDSFDEVCKKYIEKAFNIIQKLIELKVHRIVISSRQYQELLLFNQWPNTKIFHLVKLGFDDQLDMLREMLQSEEKPLSDQTVRILQNLQGQLSQPSDSSSTIMLGPSLVIHMLAQLVSDPLSGSTLTLTDQFTIYDLFERYVECFIRKAAEQKLRVDSTANYSYGDNKGRRKNFYKILGYHALKKKLAVEGIKVFFKPTEREELDQQQVESSQMNGLAYPNLKHRSFEEFFFACIMEEVFYDSQNLDQFWNYFKKFFNKANRLVRVFFFHRLAKRLARVNNVDVEEGELNQLLKLFERINNDKGIPNVSAGERKLLEKNPMVKTLLKPPQ